MKPATYGPMEPPKSRYYRTGYPCRNGHYAERLVSTGRCTQCAAEKYALRKQRAGGAA